MAAAAFGPGDSDKPRGRTCVAGGSIARPWRLYPAGSDWRRRYAPLFHIYV